MELNVTLFPPLRNTAGRSRVSLSFEGAGTIQAAIDALVDQFGPEFRQHLYDDQGRIVPAWSVFLNSQPVQLNRPEHLLTAVHDGDELAFILNIAGG